MSSGHRGLDHWAVVVSVELVSFTSMRWRRRAPAIDPEAIRHPCNQAEIERVWAGAPQCAWQVNVHEHVAVVGYLQKEMSARFPLAAGRPRDSYLTAETFALRRMLVVVRASLKRRNWALRCTRLRRALVTWKALRVRVAFHDVCAAIALDVHRLKCLEDVLRSSCKRDRAARVSRLADQLRDAPAVEANAAVKQLVRPKRFRRSGPQPLPRLQRADGQLCRTPGEVTERWREYFSAIEAGVTRDPTDLVVECLQRQQSRGPVTQIPGERLPTMMDLEEAFRSIQGRKACGPDRVSPDVCRRFCAPLAVVFWPVLLKTLLYTAEAAGCKGVTLFHIPKHKGDIADCSASRAITVQSCFSKALQRAIRPMLVDQVEESAPDLMLGGRKGQTALFGCFAVRSFLRTSRAKGVSAAAVFFDIASAYYAVIRELLVGREKDATTVEALAQGLSLIKMEMQAIASHIDAEPVLTDAGAPFLRRVVQEVGTATCLCWRMTTPWFRPGAAHGLAVPSPTYSSVRFS